MPRILVLTASFGDGHNTAARGVATALKELAPASDIEVHDLVREAEPVKGAWLQRGYSIAITHLPWVWKMIYRGAELLPFSDQRLFGLGRVEEALSQRLRLFRPEAIVLTFPLYAHLLGRLFGAEGPPLPIISVVTDSISINKVWFSPATDLYLVPDELSAVVIKSHGIAEEKIEITGFPVAPAFAIPNWQPPGETLSRALIFPSQSREETTEILESLLTQGPANLALTVVLGRHEARLKATVEALKARYSGRDLTILGWTNQIPTLMNSHDLVIGKAGGGASNECTASGRPMIITQVVPGQEEGNAELLLRRGMALRLHRMNQLGSLLTQITQDGRWLNLRQSAIQHRWPDGAQRAAAAVLKMIPRSAGS